MVQIINGNKTPIIGEKIKPKCVVHDGNNNVDRFDEFIAIGFIDSKVKIHAPTDLINIATGIEVLTDVFKKEFEELPKDMQDKLNKYLKSRGDISAEDRGKSDK